jgi:hypothetical protein
MNYNFIKLFSFRKCSDTITGHFNTFLKSNEKDHHIYQIEHGDYHSAEGLNKEYNYILKIVLNDRDIEKFKTTIKNEYEKLLGNVKSSLKNEEILSFEYESNQQLTKQSIQQKSTINHVVFLPFKENCSEKDINNAFSLLTNLFNTMEGISSFCYGKVKHTLSDKEYVFEMNFTNEINRDNYLKNEEHIKVAELIIPLLKDGENSIIAFDYLLSNNSKISLNLPSNVLFSPKIETESVDNSQSNCSTDNLKI